MPCWEADQGHIPVQKNSPDLQGCTGECQGVTLRRLACSPSPLPLACIFCSTEPVLMPVSRTKMFQAVRSQIHLGKNPCLITYNFYRNKQKQLRIRLPPNFKTVGGWQYVSLNKKLQYWKITLFLLTVHSAFILLLSYIISTIPAVHKSYTSKPPPHCPSYRVFFSS